MVVFRPHKEANSIDEKHLETTCLFSQYKNLERF
jgi:hypothetical protein